MVLMMFCSKVDVSKSSSFDTKTGPEIIFIPVFDLEDVAY